MCAECYFSSMISVFLSQGFCIPIYLLVRVRLPVCLFRSLSVLDCALVFESHSGILCVLESNFAIDCFLLKFFVFLFKYLPGSTVQYIFFISIMNLCYIHFTKHTSIPTLVACPEKVLLLWDWAYYASASHCGPPNDDDIDCYGYVDVWMSERVVPRDDAMVSESL